MLDELNSNDITFISIDRQRLDTYMYGTENSIFVEIQPNSTKMKNAPRI